MTGEGHDSGASKGEAITLLTLAKPTIGTDEDSNTLQQVTGHNIEETVKRQAHVPCPTHAPCPRRPRTAPAGWQGQPLLARATSPRCHLQAASQRCAFHARQHNTQQQPQTTQRNAHFEHLSGAHRPDSSLNGHGCAGRREHSSTGSSSRPARNSGRLARQSRCLCARPRESRLRFR